MHVITRIHKNVMLDQIHTLPFLEYSQWLQKCTIRNPDECAAIPECYYLQPL